MHTVLKKLRKDKGLRQEDIAEKLCISASAYAKIEQGKNRLVDSHFTTLAEIFEISKGELVELYLSDDDKLPEEGRISMKINIASELNFGTVEVANYFYVNFCQGPDFLKFRLKKDAAAPFIEKINIDYEAINEALKKIEPNRDDIDRIDYEVDEEDPEYIVFTAFLLHEIEVNGRLLNERQGINVLDKIDVDTFDVTCSILIEDTDFGEIFQLRLESVDVKNETNLFEGLPEVHKFALADMDPDMMIEFISNQDDYRSIDELIELGKKYNWTCSDEYAKWLFKYCVLSKVEL